MDYAGGGGNMGQLVWDSFSVSPFKPKKEEKIGLAEAITSSILSAGICYKCNLSCFTIRSPMTPNKNLFLDCRTHRASAKAILQHTIGKFLKKLFF